MEEAAFFVDEELSKHDRHVTIKSGKAYIFCMKNIYRGMDVDEYVFEKTNTYIRKFDKVIDVSIGDVTEPIAKKVAEAGAKAAIELSEKKSMRGYPPHDGYKFLKNAIVNYYLKKNIVITADQVFVTHGIKDDLASTLSLFDGITVSVPRVGYPAYKDICRLFGHKTKYYDKAEDADGDVVIICSPSNPTGEECGVELLSHTIKSAINNNRIVLFDAAYEAFSDGVGSVLSIEGAKKVAIEFCSLSKTAGFTGIRCGYTLLSQENSIYGRYKRAKAIACNGVSYVTQRMAEAALTIAKDDVKNIVKYYLRSQAIISQEVGIQPTNSPYVWVKIGDGDKAFRQIIERYNVAVMPGSAFGDGSYVRASAFCDHVTAKKVGESISAYKKIQ